MGGLGSGDWYRWDKKDVVESCRRIGVRDWYRRGLLRASSFSWCWWNRDGEKIAWINVQVEQDRVVLIYRCRVGQEEWQDVREPVDLDWTGCNYGGQRPWFICPGASCGRRMAFLYGAGQYFLCRYCYNLGYASQRENRAGRLLLKCQKIRMKLGGEPGLIYPFPPKPKHMHWATYEKLHQQAWKAELASHLAWVQMARKWEGSLG